MDIKKWMKNAQRTPVAYAGAVAVRSLMHVFCLLPIQRNTVFFAAYKGTQYSCSPRAISEYLEQHHPGKFRIVWALDKPELARELNGRGIKTVKFGTPDYMREALTARVRVINFSDWKLMPGRNGQLLINTWHGGGSYKRVGKHVGEDSKYQQALKMASYRWISLFLSSSRAFTEETLRESFEYSGEVLSCGLPRNDVFFQDSRARQREIRQRLDIAPDKKIVIYAPTMRADKRLDLYDLDVKNLRAALHDRFGGDWVVLLRTHYFVTQKIQSDFVGENCIDATGYPDMQDLLLVSDVLVTDYSSSIWDFSQTFRPCFLYATDVDQYQGVRDFYRPIEDWGFPLAKNNQQLGEVIRAFDEERFHHAMERHHEVLGSYEQGTACAEVCRRIVRACGGKS